MSQPQSQQTPQPNPELMAQQAAAQESFESNMLPPSAPPSELQLPADKVTTINIDDIKPNSILVINIDVDNPIQKMAVAPVFSKLLAPYATKLREKGVTVMLMTLHENINLISEEEMANAGWEKKAKSLIINPFSK
jgi:hypothetical protein